MLIGDKNHFLVYYHKNNEGLLEVDHLAGFDSEADVFDIDYETTHFVNTVHPNLDQSFKYHMVQMDRANVMLIFFPHGVPSEVQ